MSIKLQIAPLQHAERETTPYKAPLPATCQPSFHGHACDRQAYKQLSKLISDNTSKGADGNAMKQGQLLEGAHPGTHTFTKLNKAPNNPPILPTPFPFYPKGKLVTRALTQ